MPDTLEIEVTTVFSGPLAERLVHLAKSRAQTPVNTLADLVERGIKEDWLTTAAATHRELVDLRARYERV